MRGGTQNNLGDLLWALAVARADDPRTRRDIAAMLGFKFAGGEPGLREPKQPPAAAEEPAGGGRGAPPVVAPASEQIRGGEAMQTEAPVSGDFDDEAWIEAGRTRLSLMPEWYEGAEALDDSKYAAAPSEGPPPEPLFRPEWTRAILQSAVTTEDRKGAVDLEAVVKRLSRKEPLDLIPRVKRFRPAAAVQVLLDISETMRPFGEDQRRLLSDIRRVISSQSVSVLTFAACPTQGVSRPGGGWHADAYRPPHAGSLVLLLTDLGASKPAPDVATATTAEWLEFVGMVRQAGCTPVAFVPYPRRRVSHALRGALAVINWDRATTVAAARRLRLKDEVRALK